MKDWRGTVYHSIPEATTRNAVAEINDFLFQLSPSIKRINNNQQANSSGNSISPPFDDTGLFKLIGRSGGQDAHGDIASGGNLILSSTSHTTKGRIYLGDALTSAFDEVNEYIGLQTASPSAMLHLTSTVASQYMRPSSDAAVGGAWNNESGSGVPLYTHIDESAFDDSDYIRVTDIGAGGGTANYSPNLKVNGAGGADPSNPGGSPTYTIRFRARFTGTNGNRAVALQFQNQTTNFLNGTSGHAFANQLTFGPSGVPSKDFTLTSSFQTFTYTLSASETALVAYSNFPWRLQLDLGGVLSSSGMTIDISWIEIQISSGVGTDTLQTWEVGGDSNSLAVSGSTLKMSGTMPLRLAPTSDVRAIVLNAGATADPLQIRSNNDNTLLANFDVSGRLGLNIAASSLGQLSVATSALGTSTVGNTGDPIEQWSYTSSVLGDIVPMKTGTSTADAVIRTVPGHIQFYQSSITTSALRIANSSTIAFIQCGRLQSDSSVINKNLTLDAFGGTQGTALSLDFATISTTGLLSLAAGTTTVAPLKFTSGTSLTTAVAGSAEFTTDDLFFTITTGTARKRVALVDPTGGLTSGRVAFATTNGRLTDDSDLTFAADTLTATKIVGSTSVKVGTASGYIASDGSTGVATGTFTTADSKTVTVTDGIITSIV